MDSSSSSSSTERRLLEKKEKLRKEKLEKEKLKKQQLKQSSKKKNVTPDKPTKVSESSSESKSSPKPGFRKIPMPEESESSEIVFREKIVFIPEPTKKVEEPKPVVKPVEKRKPQTKVINDDSSSEQSESEKKERKKAEKFVVTGEKQIFISKDYTIKIDDTIIVIDSEKPVKIKLYPITGNQKNSYNMSKKIIIKALRGLLQHTIECDQKNSFDKDSTRRVLTLVGRDSIQLQSAGTTWIVV